MRLHWGVNYLGKGVQLICITLGLIQTTKAETDPCSSINQSLKAGIGDTCFYVPSESLTWSRSRRDCQVLGSHLAVLDTDVKTSTVRALLTSAGVDEMWIGAIKQQMTETSWENGRKLQGPISSYPWSDENSFVIDRGTGDDCVYMDQTKRWGNDFCYDTKSLICQFDKGSPGCSPGPGREVMVIGSSCYLIEFGEFSWFRAREKCITLGTHMVRAENVTQFNLLVTKLESSPSYKQQDIWLGLTRNKWIWLTGEEMVRTYWAPMQPSAEGLCVVLHKYATNEYKWKTVPCKNQLKYICQKDVVNEDPAVTDAPASQNTPANKTGLHGGLLFLLILLALVLAGIVIFMACYIRRGRAIKKRARAHASEYNARQANRPTRDEGPTDFAIFSCDIEQPNTRQLNSDGRLGQLPPLPSIKNGHLKSNGIQNKKAEEKRLLQNNNLPKVPKLQLESEVNNKKHAPKSAGKYKDVVDDSYDFELDDAPKPGAEYDNGSDYEAVYRDINNFEPNSSAQMTENDYEMPFDAVQYSAEGDDHIYEEPVQTSAKTPKSKRDKNVYQSAEIFALRDSLKIQLPRGGTEDSLVMESIQADDYENSATGGEKAEDVKRSYDETDRSQYIEDVAKAFDFLVSKDGYALDKSVSDQKGNGVGKMLHREKQRRGSMQTDSGIVSEAAEGDSPKKEELKERINRDSSREKLRRGPERQSMRERIIEKHERENLKEKTKRRSESFRERRKAPDSTDGDAMYRETSKLPRKLHGEKEKEGGHRHQKKKEGHVNGAYTGTDSELDEDSARKRHKHKRHREYTEEELAERHRKKKEREILKREADSREDLAKLGVPDPDDLGLTRVGSPMPSGKLPPLVPHSEEKRKKHRHHKEHRSDGRREHRKHKSEMTEEEKEERRRRHKRKREKEKRRRERAMRANQPEAKRIQVEGGTEDEEEEEEEGSIVSGLSSGDDSENGSVKGTPKSAGASTPGGSSRSGRIRQNSASGRLVYDIDNAGAGDGIEV